MYPLRQRFPGASRFLRYDLTIVQKLFSTAFAALVTTSSAANSFDWSDLSDGLQDLSLTKKTTITIYLETPDGEPRPGYYCDQDSDGVLDEGCVSVDVYFPRIPDYLRFWLQEELPIVVLLQGALVDARYYENVARGMALQKFVVAVPNLLRFVPGFGVAPFTAVGIEKETYAAIRQEAITDPTSELYKIRRLINFETIGLGGHSFGAAMSLYAISGFCFPGLCTESVPPPSFDPISGWQPNYETFTNLGGAALYGVSLADSIVPDLDTRNIPIAILNGTEDGITTTDDAWAAYQQLELERAFVTVGGANHCGICDVDKPEGAQLEDDGEAILDQIEANFYVARWLGFWYRAELKDDSSARFWIDSIGGSLNGVVNVEELERIE